MSHYTKKETRDIFDIDGIKKIGNGFLSDQVVFLLFFLLFFLFRPNSHCLRAFPNIIFVPHSFPNTICHKNLMTLWHLSKRNFSTFAFYLFHNPLAIQTEALREIEKDGMMMIKYIWFLNDWHCCIFSTKRVISVDIPVKSVKFHFYQFQFLPKLNMMCIVQDWTWRTKVWKLSQSSLTLWSLGKSSIKQLGQLCLGSGEHLNVISNKPLSSCSIERPCSFPIKFLKTWKPKFRFYFRMI